MIRNADIFSISSYEEFKDLALKIFAFQFENNSVYRSFCDLLHKHPSDVSRIEDIPFLPIQFFKSHNVIIDKAEAEKTFLSSGTTQSNRSQHQVADLDLYVESFAQAFKYFYGNNEDYAILGLLPNYMQQGDSSLIYMIDHLIAKSNVNESGFYKDDLHHLKSSLMKLEAKKQKTLLIGVTYALLDLIETCKLDLEHTIVMETGGMKGRRKELIREELHAILKAGFGVKHIHSEYGMTELLSQAYSKGNGIFKCPNWMRVLSRSVQDPLKILDNDKSGGLNVIDLANINSCSFIATQDLGKIHPDGSFEVLGRFDNAEIRGCNLMVL